MLSTIEYLSLLRKYMRENAVKYGISRMGIFGSVARGEQHDGSDVDICVEIDRPSIFTLVHIKEELEKLFKCPPLLQLLIFLYTPKTRTFFHRIQIMMPYYQRFWKPLS